MNPAEGAHSQAFRFWNKDCKRTALWRRLYRAAVRGPKGQSAKAPISQAKGQSGMTCEGTLRKADWNNQGLVDACMYSILRSEYHD